MITITEEQFLQMSLTERDFVRTLITNRKATETDEQAAVRKRISDHFAREKEEQKYTEELEKSFI